MPRLTLENLDQEERAFVESIEGLHRSIETLKMVYSGVRFHTALESMQAVQEVLVAAALKSVR